MLRWAAQRRVSRGLLSCRQHSALAHKIDVAPAVPVILTRHPPKPADPYLSLASELSTLRTNLLTLLGSAHPSLQDVANHYFHDSSNLIRSTVILLFARATNPMSPGWNQAVCTANNEDASELDLSLTRPDVLHYWNPNMPDHAESFDSVFALRSAPFSIPRRQSTSTVHYSLLPSQLRLAQIVEMIHVASLLHDQVTPSPTDSSNKLSILGGDFLLGRACAALSRLGSDHAVELIASVISNLSEGRIVISDSWDEFIKNAYLKTGSLVAKGARSAVLLAGGNAAMQDVAYAFGRNLGISMQLLEYAVEGDHRCWEAAHMYSHRAVEVLDYLPDSEYRHTLQHFVEGMVERCRGNTCL